MKKSRKLSFIAEFLEKEVCQVGDDFRYLHKEEFKSMSYRRLRNIFRKKLLKEVFNNDRRTYKDLLFNDAAISNIVGMRLVKFLNTFYDENLYTNNYNEYDEETVELDLLKDPDYIHLFRRMQLAHNASI